MADGFEQRFYASGGDIFKKKKGLMALPVFSFYKYPGGVVEIRRVSTTGQRPHATPKDSAHAET